MTKTKTSKSKRREKLLAFAKAKGLSKAELRDLLKHMKKPRMIQEPVSFSTFVEHKDYMDAEGLLYQKVMEAGEAINSGKYVEAIFTGPIGTGKTTLALYTMAYQLYVLLCYEDPHAVFGLDPASEILMVFQSISKSLAKDIDYQRFRAMVERAPWFTGEFTFNKNIESELRFKNRIIIRPIHGGESGAIGQNVIGGIIDELNFMNVVADSKKNPDGGDYDQAMKNYQSIARRRESRFMTQGDLPGMLCLVSSRRYKGQFTDKKEEEAKDPKKRIYVFDEKVWTIKPEAFIGDTFDVFLGNDTHTPFIVKNKQKLTPEEKASVMAIPEEYRTSFEGDILAAIRDIAGMSTNAIHPFIVNTSAVSACFNRQSSIFSRPSVDFVDTKLKIYPKRFRDPGEPRFVHIDLAFSKDSCGVAIGYVPKFVSVTHESGVETMPLVSIDGILEVKPPRNGEIQFGKVRDVIYTLMKLGLNVQWVTFDQFQSKDSKQILARKGLQTGTLSLDKDTLGYEITKTAFYEGRVLAPAHTLCLHELVTLEHDEKKNKVDHRPNGSKDCADALAGVVWGLHRRRELWMRHKVPLQEQRKALMKIAETTQKPKAEPSKGLLDIGE